MSKNSSILESFLRITASVLLLLLNLCVFPRYVTVLLYLDRTTVVVFLREINSLMKIWLHFFPSAELFYFFCQCQLPPRCQDVLLQSLS